MPTQVQGPWEVYQGESEGPWTQYDKEIPPPAVAAPPKPSPEDVPLSAKPIPDQPAPMRVRQQFLRTHGAGNVTERGINEANKTAAENTGLMIAGEGVGEVAGPLVRPFAEYANENIIPAIERGVPYAGRVIKFAEEAPSAVKAAVRGGTTGAAYGGVEGAFRGHPVRDALVGGLTGGALGAGVYGIGRLADPNVPFAGEAEPPLTEDKPLVPDEVANPPISVRRGPGEIAPEHIGRPQERVGPFPGIGKELPGGGVIVRPTPLLPASPEEITFRTDQNGTKWAKVPGAPAEVSVPKSLSGADAESYAREKLDLQSKFARRSGMRNLTPAMEEATGAKDLSKVPLRDQPFHGEPRPVGADVLVPPQRDPRAGVLPRTPPGSRVAVPIAEEFGPTAKAPGKFPAALTEEPARQMGVEPDAKAVEQARLEKKYPDRATRQMAHSQGDRIVDAVGDDSKLMKEVHDLTRVDLRQALINSGEDVGQRTVTDSKFAGEGGIPRKKAFEMLLDKGLTPREIVKLARKP